VADRTDFDVFVTARSAALLRSCYLLTHNWASAEDLLQTALAKAWFAWGRIDGNPEPYLRSVIVNTYTSWWRRRWNGELPADDLPEPGRVDGRDAMAEVDDRDVLWAALGRLPRRQRAVVVLRFYEDLTEVQTAAVLGVTVGTVKSQTSKALASMRIDAALAPDTVTSVRRRDQEGLT
jgi:RNA polymerase sigma-70 factor (sigma-E family)